MLSRSELRLITLQETTTVSGATLGNAAGSVGSFLVQPHSRTVAPKTAFHMLHTRSCYRCKVHRVRRTAHEPYSPRDDRRARLLDMRRLLPNGGRRTHLDPSSGFDAMASDRPRRHRGCRPARPLRNAGIRDPGGRGVCAPRNPPSPKRMSHLRDPRNHMPGVRKGQPAMPGVPARCRNRPMTPALRVLPAGLEIE